MQEVISNFNLPAIFGKPLDLVDNIIENKEQHVRHIEIPKKDGTKRKILAPDDILKYIQKGIYYRVLRRYKPSPIAHGFISKRSIVTNADVHVGAISMGKIDIKSFFDTINENHLKNCLFGNKNICRYCKNYERMLNGQCSPSLYHNKTKKYDYRCEEIKAVYIPEYCKETGYQSLFNRIIQLSTYHGTTAQGFPTSPVLANIVMRGFDEKIMEYCKKRGVNCSRYADDIAFSSKEIGKYELKDFIQTKIYRWLWAFGFKPNREKTTWKSKGGRLKICGIVVNTKKSIQRSVMMRFRAMVHHATVKEADKTTKSMLRKLKGYASFVMSVDFKKGKKYMDQLIKFENEKLKPEVNAEIV